MADKNRLLVDEIEEEIDTSLKKIEEDFNQNYCGGLDLKGYTDIRIECGCETCDCDTLSQDSYHNACHTFGLFDQNGDATNSTESGGNYDESIGFKKGCENTDEEFKYFSLH